MHAGVRNDGQRQPVVPQPPVHAMRIAVVTDLGRRAGGAESYLASVIPGLKGRGHDVLFAYEADEPGDRAPVVDASRVGTVDIAALGHAGALAELERWRPDVIFVHGARSLDFGDALRQVAPSAYFSHQHAGMCIAGRKALMAPAAKACTRPFDAGCLLYYFPRRCGGLSPVTLARSYRREQRRRDSFGSYDAIVCGSRYMAAEISRYLPGDVPVHVAPLFVDPPASAPAAARAASPGAADGVRRIVFASRLYVHKGASVLVKAAGLLASRGPAHVHVEIVGDGPERDAVAREARRVEAETAGRVRVTMPGWLTGASLAEAMARADVFAMPSLAPETFGLAGLDAGVRGLPCVAFGIGGVDEWLTDGFNGHLASAQPADAAALADALDRAFASDSHLQALKANALRVAARFTLEAHLPLLEAGLEAAVARRREHRTAEPVAGM